MKLAQFLQAGCNVKILLADVHGFLDNLKAPIELVEYRAKYYRHCIMALLRAVNVPVDKLEFVLGSSYQMSPVRSPSLDTGLCVLRGAEIRDGFVPVVISDHRTWCVFLVARVWSVESG